MLFQICKQCILRFTSQAFYLRLSCVCACVCVCVCVCACAQSCSTLWDPMDCSRPGSSLHGILQARVLESVAISFSRGSSQPRDWTRVSHTVADALPTEPPGKSMRGHNSLKVKVLVAQWCLTFCDPMDCSPPGSSVHGSLQARILEWVAISFSRGSSQPRDQTKVSCIAGRFLYHLNYQASP